MGFWDKAADLAKKAGSAAIDEFNAAGDRNKEYKESMTLMSDQELAKIATSERELKSSPLKAGAAIKELKSRGYTTQTIRDI